MDNTETLQAENEKLRKENEHLRGLLKIADRRLHEEMGKAALYERVTKDKAKRGRKAAPDRDGYIITGAREIMDRYEHDDGKGHVTLLPIVAYRTTLSMPYPSGLGFDELRRRLEIDLIGNGHDHYLQYNGWDGLGYRLGMDRIIEGCPVDGKHPGKDKEINDGLPHDPVCILYRTALNLCKEYAEVELYTTAPLYLWDDPYKPGKEKGGAE